MNMNIDKFGHHVHKRLRFAQNIFNCDDTLKKSEDGDFDLRLSRLKGIKSPLSSDDAVNKDYVDNINKSIQTNLANILLRLRRIDSVLSQIDEKFYTKEEINKIISEIIKEKTQINKINK